ncbi:MAG TPA: hypothetical protein VGI56_11965 [Galbitalea sp.]|jgi:hypothetical protein
MTDERPMGPHNVVTSKLYDQEDERGVLHPGQEGYWKVWGARAIDIRPGDLVMSGWKDKLDDGTEVIQHAEYEVAEMASFTAPTMNTIRVGFIGTNGLFGSVGMLQAMVLLRWGTGNKLADSI